MSLVECPKRMTYGPCGGVGLDGRCEVAPEPCVFLPRPTVAWSAPAGAGPVAAPPAAATEMRRSLARGGVVVADFPGRALDAGSLAECAAILAGHVDAVLLGDSGTARVQFPPSYRAELARRAGLTVWAGVNCRDRNRVAIEGELAALAHAGVAAVHCVTGDHTATGHRPDAMPVFDLDSTRATAAAAAAGHLVSVAEAPLAPPVERRPERLLQKVRAGAEVCFVNHAGGPGPVAAFVDRVRDTGAEVALVPCVPVVLDAASARLLATFAGLVLPAGYLDRILAAADPWVAGIAAATELGQEFLALDGVAGVNLSGGPGPGGEAAFAAGLAAVADGLRAVSPAGG
jgi:5,10-methylenetetrahydrofolate reductase